MEPTAEEITTDNIASIRRFNRFYTQHIGVLTDSLLGSPLALSEARVLFEIAQHESSTASQVAGSIGIDRGYLSRILKKLEHEGLITTCKSDADGRRRILTLAEAGQRLYEAMNARSEKQVVQSLAALSPSGQDRLLDAMETIESLLSQNTLPAEEPCVLRDPEPGDLGHLVHRHGVLYAREQGFDDGFEAIVADIVAKFVFNRDPERERLWIADIAGRIAGSVMLVKETERLARLRLFLVEPAARGRGVGTLLLDELLGFARAKGFAGITLTTVSRLDAARHLYERAGFRKDREEAMHIWSQDLVEEEWVLDL